MTLISAKFLLFILVVTGMYFALPMRLRPGWLLLCNIAFYMFSDPRCLVFLALSIISCHYAALAMLRAKPRQKKLLLMLALGLNLGLLAVIKYLPFTADLLGRAIGMQFTLPRFLVPLGISFYTLQAAGYLIDVYRGDTQAEEKLWHFALFMSYFPIIMQGPISSHPQLAAQLKTPHSFDYKNFSFGLQLMLWGFFKKMVIADRMAVAVNELFANHQNYEGIMAASAACLYILQLYADFSGCVDISRGSAQMLGIEVAENFRRPLFSTSISDFWRRWHVSLGTWFRKYVYIPLGGSRRGELRMHINTLIVFTLSGTWHGTGLGYMFWGLLNGMYMVGEEQLRKLSHRVPFKLPGWLKLPASILRHAICLALVFLMAVFARAPGLSAAFSIVFSIFRGSWIRPLVDGSFLRLGLDMADIILLLLSLLLLLCVSLMQERNGGNGSISVVREKIAGLSLPLRWCIYLAGIFAVMVFGIYGPGYNSAQFIYMNF